MTDANQTKPNIETMDEQIVAICKIEPPGQKLPQEVINNQLEFILILKQTAISILQKYVERGAQPTYYFLEEFLTTWIARNTQFQSLAIYLGHIKKDYINAEMRIQIQLRHTLTSFSNVPDKNQLQTFTYPRDEPGKSLILGVFFKSQPQLSINQEYYDVIQPIYHNESRKRSRAQWEIGLETEEMHGI